MTETIVSSLANYHIVTLAEHSDFITIQVNRYITAERENSNTFYDKHFTFSNPSYLQ